MVHSLSLGYVARCEQQLFLINLKFVILSYSVAYSHQSSKYGYFSFRAFARLSDQWDSAENEETIISISNSYSDTFQDVHKTFANNLQQ